MVPITATVQLRRQGAFRRSRPTNPAWIRTDRILNLSEAFPLLEPPTPHLVDLGSVQRLDAVLAFIKEEEDWPPDRM